MENQIKNRIPTLVKIFYIIVITLLLIIVNKVYQEEVKGSSQTVVIPCLSSPELPDNNQCYKEVIEDARNQQHLKELLEENK